MREHLTRQETDDICERVYRRFPQMRGVRPTVRRQQAQGQDRFLLRFEATVALEGGGRLQTTVRVVTSADGRILKMTSSH